VDLLAHITGYGAVVLTILGLSLVNDRMLRFLNLSGCLLFTLHYLILEQYSAFLMLVLASVMIASSIAGKARILDLAWIINISLVPAAALLIFFGKIEIISIFPIIAGLFMNTGVSKLSGTRMTAALIIGSAFWIPPAIAMESMPVLISVLLNIVSLTYREIKRHRLEKNLPPLSDHQVTYALSSFLSSRPTQVGKVGSSEH
jgi:hypothetical protein